MKPCRVGAAGVGTCVHAVSPVDMPDAGRERKTTKTERANAKNPAEYRLDGVFAYCLLTSLTITYFHTGRSTIIGAKSFHGPVRDGKGWDRLAMVIRL